MRRWPPVLWLLMFLASSLILGGSLGGWRPVPLIAGLALALFGFAAAAYLALVPGEGPRPRAAWVAIGALAAFYAAVAAAAALAGPEYAVAGLLAGTIPLTALCLIIATTRRKTAEERGRLDDVSGDARDPYPGIGIDTTTPLGDTPEHSDAIDEPVASQVERIRERRRRERGAAGGT